MKQPPFQVLVSLVWLAVVAPAFAQDSNLKFRMTPKEAYLFFDGRAEPEGCRTLLLGPDEHKMSLYVYGYQPDTRSLTIKSGVAAPREVSPKPVSREVSGPWGRIPEASRPSILLNVIFGGLSFGGHGDEFINKIVLERELLVPRATHEVTLLESNKAVWWGRSPVASDQRETRLVEQRVPGERRWIRRAMKGFVRALRSTPPGLPAPRSPFFR
jgi:hypothetical protein